MPLYYNINDIIKVVLKVLFINSSFLNVLIYYKDIFQQCQPKCHFTK